MKVMTALGIGAIVPDTLDQAGKNKQTIKTEKAKFDSILGNESIKPMKPVEAPKLASDLIDLLYKEAQEEEKGEAKEIIPKAALATLLGLAVADAVVNKNILAPVHSIKDGAYGFARKIPELLSKHKASPKYVKMMSGAARIAKKKSADETKKNIIDKATMGIGFGTSAAIANFVVHALGDQYFKDEKTKDLIKKSYEDGSFIDQTGLHTMRKPILKAIEDMDKKTASSTIDELYKEAAKFDNIREYGKKVLVEDIAQNAIKSIPFALVPVGASYAINRNLKKDMSKVRGQDNQQTDKIVIEVPRDQVKIAGDYKPMPWKEFFKYELPSSVVRSLTWILPATALTALTNRNFHSVGEKIQNDQQPIEQGKARISIYKNKGSSRQLGMDSKNM